MKNYDELRQAAEAAAAKRMWWKLANAADPQTILALLDENAALRARIDRAVNLGHNDDCMFCGFKDKALGDVS